MKKGDKMNFSIKLKKLRSEHKITQEQLASKINVERSLIGKYESNAAMPSNDTLIRIAEYFQVSTDYLLGVNKTVSTSKQNATKIPVFGDVAAGIPISAIEDIVDYEEITEDMANTGEYFGLVIKGDSMEPRMRTGDVVIVRSQSTIENGEIAIIMVNGDTATCKKIKKTPEGIMLLSFNPAHEPIFYTNKEIEQLPVRILGKVVELRAKF